MADSPVISGASFIISPVASAINSLISPIGSVGNQLTAPVLSNGNVVISPAIGASNLVSTGINSANIVMSPEASGSNFLLSAACNVENSALPRSEDCNTVRINTLPTNQNIPTYTTAINFHPMPVVRMNVPVLNKQPDGSLIYMENPLDFRQRIVGDTIFLVANNADGNMYEPNLVLQPTPLQQTPNSPVIVRFPNSSDQHQNLNRTEFIPNQEQIPLETSNKRNETEVEPELELKDIICEHEGCKKKFANREDLNLHKATHRERKSLVCSYPNCGREFSWPSHLKYHLLTHSGKRQYKCDFQECGKTFYTPQRLEVHMRTHSGVKPFECAVCKKSFTTYGNLKNHLRIHTGERPYACDLDGCARIFTEMSSLKKHKLVHTGEKPFSCEKCGKMFTQSGSRTAHMKRHKLSKENEEDNREETDRCSNAKLETPNVLVLGEADANMLSYEEFGTDRVVFPQTISDQIVTVTTQSSESDSNQINLSNGILNEEILGNDEKDSAVEDNSNTTMIFCQSHDMTSLSSFHSEHITQREEVVYGAELLQDEIEEETEMHIKNIEDNIPPHTSHS